MFLCTLSPLHSVISPACCLTPGSLHPSGLWLPSSQLKEPPAPGLLPSLMQCPQLGRSLLLDLCPRDDIDVLVCRGCHGTSPRFPSRKLQCSGTLQKIASYLLGEKWGTVRSWLRHLSVCVEGEKFWVWVTMWKQHSMRIKFPGALCITQAADCTFSRAVRFAVWFCS